MAQDLRETSNYERGCTQEWGYGRTHALLLGKSSLGVQSLGVQSLGVQSTGVYCKRLVIRRWKSTEARPTGSSFFCRL